MRPLFLAFFGTLAIALVGCDAGPDPHTTPDSSDAPDPGTGADPGSPDDAVAGPEDAAAPDPGADDSGSEVSTGDDFPDSAMPGDAQDVAADLPLDLARDSFDAAQPTGRIVGHVRFSNLDDDSGILVVLSSSAPAVVIAQAVTGPEGAYAFEDVPPGAYVITASWGADTVEGLVVARVEVAAGAVATPDVPDLTATGDIAGSARLEGRVSGNLGVQVFLPGKSFVSFTDDSGAYELSKIPVGSYTVCARQDDYVTACTEPLAVRAGETADGGQLDLALDGPANPDHGILKGRVTLAGMADSSGIRIGIEGTSFFSTTDADGSFHLEVPQGQYDLRLDAPDGSGYEQGAMLPAFLVLGNVTYTLPDLALSRGFHVGDATGLHSLITTTPATRYLEYHNASGRVALWDLATGSSRELPANVDSGNYFVYPDRSHILYSPHLGDAYHTPSGLLYRVPYAGGDSVLITDKYGAGGVLTPDAWYFIYGYQGSSYTIYLGTGGGPVGTPYLLCTGREWMDPSGKYLMCNVNGTFSLVRISSAATLYWTTVPTTDDSSFALTADGKYLIVQTAAWTIVRVDMSTYQSYTFPKVSKSGFLITPDSPTLLYRTIDGLESVPIAGGAYSMLVAGAAGPAAIPPETRDLLYYDFTSGSADIPRYDVYRVGLDGSGVPVRIAQKVGAMPGAVTPLPGRSAVALRIWDATRSQYGIAYAPLDGSGAIWMFQEQSTWGWKACASAGVALGADHDGIDLIWFDMDRRQATNLGSGAFTMSPDCSGAVLFSRVTGLDTWTPFDGGQTLPLTALRGMVSSISSDGNYALIDTWIDVDTSFYSGDSRRRLIVPLR